MFCSSALPSPPAPGSGHRASGCYSTGSNLFLSGVLLKQLLSSGKGVQRHGWHMGRASCICLQLLWHVSVSQMETHWGLTCSPPPSPAWSRPPTAEGLALGHPCSPTRLAAPPSPGRLRLLPARTACLSPARGVALLSVFSFIPKCICL